MVDNTKTTTDILIIGGGIAGCIAAIALADDYKITLIDKLSEPVERIGESLAPAAQRILRQLRILNHLDPISEQQLFIKNLGMQSYWGSDQVHFVDHLRNPDGLGLNLNRKAFECYLRKIASQKGVECIWPTKLYRSSYVDSAWEITTKSEDKKKTTHQIKSRFVIDATGRQSQFAKSLGIKRIHYDKLITCWASMPNVTENKMSTISACDSGWWYSAVIPNNRRVLAFQTDSDLIERGVFKNLDSFLLLAKNDSVIAKILNETNGEITFHGTSSANSTRLEQVAGRQWVALGDATVSFDPLSSQGMFYAMASGMLLKAMITRFDIISSLNEHNLAQFQNEYSRHTNEVWSHYIHQKNLYYCQEMRWKESPFWKRRHQRDQLT